MKPTLVVMAAGMGSRYGGLKQIDPVGPLGERIIDYSLYDAARAGFGKIVFIIRKNIERDFRGAIEPGIAGRLSVEYVFQELTAIPPAFRAPESRSKPWGTGHAILCCRDAVNEPFGVINADDFYGRDAYVRLARGLAAGRSADDAYVLVGYDLANTLSPHGSVSRGVCELDEDGRLVSMEEKTHITRENTKIVSREGDRRIPLAPETTVSMNMWGFKPGVFAKLEASFERFLQARGTELKSEFYIPSAVDAMLSNNDIQVHVTRTSARWMGMTYPEDRAIVCAGVASLIEAGDYSSPLW